MRLGFMTEFSDEVVEFANEVGFGCLELRMGPGSDVNADYVINGGAERIRAACDQADLEISSLGHYCNHLDPDPTARANSNQYLEKLIDAAALLEVDTVCTFAGRLPEEGLEANVSLFQEVMTPLVAHAAEKGVRIAIENCPTMHGHPFRGTNFAFNPEAWDAMFEAVDSPNLGLELDPSHLLWLEIDYVGAVYDYADRIFHIHAKDTEILSGKLNEVGIYGTGWWRYRVPGWGEVDWQRFVSALLDIDYQGNIDIEHEDPVFSGERHEEGLVRGFAHLSKLVL